MLVSRQEIEEQALHRNPCTESRPLYHYASTVLNTTYHYHPLSPRIATYLSSHTGGGGCSGE